jgi:hypothetical protein
MRNRTRIWLKAEFLRQTGVWAHICMYLLFIYGLRYVLYVCMYLLFPTLSFVPTLLFYLPPRKKKVCPAYVRMFTRGQFDWIFSSFCEWYVLIKQESIFVFFPYSSSGNHCYVCINQTRIYLRFFSLQ